MVNKAIVRAPALHYLTQFQLLLLAALLRPYMLQPVNKKVSVFIKMSRWFLMLRWLFGINEVEKFH